MHEQQSVGLLFTRAEKNVPYFHVGRTRIETLNFLWEVTVSKSGTKCDAFVRMLQFDCPSTSATACSFLARFVNLQFLFRKSKAPEECDNLRN
jgi:hypothetical protein